MGITAAPPSTGVTRRAPPASEAIQWCPGSQSFLPPFTWRPASRWRSETSRVTSRAAAKTTRPAAEHHPPLGAAAPLHKYKKSVLCWFKSLKVLFCSWPRACLGSRLAPPTVTHLWCYIFYFNPNCSCPSLSLLKAVCCSDMTHCCPTGYTCSEGGQCSLRTSRLRWFNWGNKKRFWLFVFYESDRLQSLSILLVFPDAFKRMM